MRSAEPNQVRRQRIEVSTVLILGLSKGQRAQRNATAAVSSGINVAAASCALIIIGVGVSGPA